MKRSTLTIVLLVAVIGGLIASTGYAFKLMADFKDKYENQLKTNDKLTEENNKIVEASEKKNEEIEKQKKEIASLKVRTTSNNEGRNEMASTVNEQTNDIPIQPKLPVVQTTEVSEQPPETNIVEEPQYAVLEEGIARFSINHSITIPALLALNGLTNENELIHGNSYRIK